MNEVCCSVSFIGSRTHALFFLATAGSDVGGSFVTIVTTSPLINIKPLEKKRKEKKK